MEPSHPSSWKFLGSEVLNKSNKELAIKSSHEAVIDGVPLRMDRYAYFRAGDTFFVLSVRINNVGDRPIGFYYVYGDEPWVGDFGSSKGNVGWVDGKLIKTVQYVDAGKYSYAGYFDYGNDLVSPEHDFTKTANFIEWSSKDKPLVYFSNSPMDSPKGSGEGAPLGSDERYIGIQWGPKVLKPGESVHYVLAIGMAGNDPKTGFPVKPKVVFK